MANKCEKMPNFPHNHKNETLKHVVVTVDL